MPTTTPAKRRPALNEDKKGEVHPRNTLNDLTAKEWIAETVSVWTQRGLGRNHAEAQIERQHPAPFSFQDVSRLIRFFTKPGQTVLDPFVGVGSTLKAAAIEGRKGIGIEISEKYAALAQERLATEVDATLFPTSEQKVLVGDARVVLDQLPPASVNLVVTSPPYWNILEKKDHKAKQERESLGLDTKYSENDSADLGNIGEYRLFLDQLTIVFEKAAVALARRGHMCVIVGDFRHKARYFMYHADIMNILESLGLVAKGLQILYQRHKRVFPYGYPAAFVPNIHHQYIVIVQKP